MDRIGFLVPETEAAAKRHYDALEPTAKGVVREATRAMSFDSTEYNDRVTQEVFDTAQDALFASLLQVTAGSREEFDSYREENDVSFAEVGSEHVERVVWHAPPFAAEGVAATFQNERDAAAETLRRQAFGRFYRGVIDR